MSHWWYTYVPYALKFSNTTFHPQSVFMASLLFLQWASVTFISHAADILHFLWGELHVIKDISVTWSLTEASLPKRLIGVFETVYEADQSPALRLGTHWKEVILDPSVVALFFTVSYLTFSDNSYLVPGACGGTVGWGTVLHDGRTQVQFLMGSLEFLIDINLSAALWPWCWLSL